MEVRTYGTKHIYLIFHAQFINLTWVFKLKGSPDSLTAIKNNTEDHGRKPVGESVPAEGWKLLKDKIV